MRRSGVHGARRLAVVLALATGLACGRTSSTVPSEGAGASAAESPSAVSGPAPESARPDAELQALDQCSAAMMSMVDRPAAGRAQALEEGWGSMARCGELFLRRCAPSIDPEDDPLERAHSTIGACLSRYCARWSGDERPALCDEGPVVFLESPDGETARTRAGRFIAAMLAADFGRPRDDATIERVADRFAVVWAAPVMAMTVGPPTMGDEPEADPLDLRVGMSMAGGFVLSGLGIELIELPAGDLEGLRREAEALKERHPGARTVVIAADDDVQMQQLLQAMAVLQGDCSAGESDPRCLFPRVSLAVAP